MTVEQQMERLKRLLVVQKVIDNLISTKTDVDNNVGKVTVGSKSSNMKYTQIVSEMRQTVDADKSDQDRQSMHQSQSSSTSKNHDKVLDYDQSERSRLEQELQQCLIKQQYRLESLSQDLDTLLAFKNLLKFQYNLYPKDDENKLHYAEQYQYVWAIQVYTQDIIKRFKFHFESPTSKLNRVDKFEWWINYLHKVLSKHQQFNWSPLMVKDCAASVDLFQEFMVVIVRECLLPKVGNGFKTVCAYIDKAQYSENADDTQLSSESSGWVKFDCGSQQCIRYNKLLCDLVKEVIQLDGALIDSYGLQLDEYKLRFSSSIMDSPCLAVITSDQELYDYWFNALIITQNYQLDMIMVRSDLWLRAFSDADIQDDQFRCAKSSLMILDLLQDIEDITQSVNKQSQKLDLCDLGHDLIDRVMEFIEGDLVDPLVDRFPYRKPIAPEDIGGSGLQQKSQLTSGGVISSTISSGVDRIKDNQLTATLMSSSNSGKTVSGNAATGSSGPDSDLDSKIWVQGCSRWLCALSFLLNALDNNKIEDGGESGLLFLQSEPDRYRDLIQRMQRIIESLTKVITVSCLYSLYQVFDVQCLARVLRNLNATANVDEIKELLEGSLYSGMVKLLSVFQLFRDSLPYDVVLNSGLDETQHAYTSSAFVSIVKLLMDSFDAHLFKCMLKIQFKQRKYILAFTSVIDKFISVLAGNIFTDLQILRMDQLQLNDLLFPRLSDGLKLLKMDSSLMEEVLVDPVMLEQIVKDFRLKEKLNITRLSMAGCVQVLQCAQNIN
ncbi:hypothetical protein MIR68_000143 [Amoeboaphelidium protococcarum]|nr:hypothetical protein MIR68_000143 [Amoeboaphelidium protococcarum]